MPRPAPLLTIGQPDPASRVSYAGHPAFALGFRPFYLLAAAFAAIGMAAWAVLLLGGLSSAHGPALAPLFWHAHEMVFGFAAAVVVGFLFTAGKNWTGLQTPQGKPGPVTGPVIRDRTTWKVSPSSMPSLRASS